MSKFATIYKSLNEANWIFKGAKYFSSIFVNYEGVLYVGNSSAIGSMKPVAQITKDGIRHIYKMVENETLTLIRNWSAFKISFHQSIIDSIEERQKEINQRIKHLSYVQEKINEFCI